MGCLCAVEVVVPKGSLSNPDPDKRATLNAPTVFKNGLKVRVAGDSNSDVYAGPEKRPDRAGDGLCPATKYLHCESDTWNLSSVNELLYMQRSRN